MNRISKLLVTTACLCMVAGACKAETIYRAICIAGIANQGGSTNFQYDTCDKNLENCLGWQDISVKNISDRWFRPAIVGGTSRPGAAADDTDEEIYVIVKFDWSYTAGYQEKRYVVPTRRSNYPDCSLYPNYHFERVNGGIELYKGCSPLQDKRCWY